MDAEPNIFDLILMAVMAFFMIRAIMRGFVRELMGLVGVCGALIISSLTFKPVSKFLSGISGVESAWWDLGAFLLILAVVFAFLLYFGGIIAKVVNAGPFSGLDRLIGGALGLAKGVLVCYLLVNLLLLVMMVNPNLQKNISQSYLAPYVVSGGRYLMDLVPDDVIRTLQTKAGLLGRELTSAPAEPAETPAGTKSQAK